MIKLKTYLSEGRGVPKGFKGFSDAIPVPNSKNNVPSVPDGYKRIKKNGFWTLVKDKK